MLFFNLLRRVLISALWYMVCCMQAPALHAQDQAIFLNASITPQTLYVNSELIYRLKLYYRIGVEQPRLTEPRLADAMVRMIQPDRHFQTLLLHRRNTFL